MEFQKVETVEFKNNNAEYIDIKLSKNSVIGESRDSLLFIANFSDYRLKFWINKKAIFYYNYSNILKVSLINKDDFKYNLYLEENKDWKKPNYQASGKQLNDKLLLNKDIQILNN